MYVERDKGLSDCARTPLLQVTDKHISRIHKWTQAHATGIDGESMLPDHRVTHCCGEPAAILSHLTQTHRPPIDQTGASPIDSRNACTT